jgi:hypothetical protein
MRLRSLIETADQPVADRVARHDREIAGGLLLHVDIDHDPVGCRAGRIGDLDCLEVPEILQPPLGALEQSPVVGIAFRDLELAPNDFVVSLAVAVDGDALDVAARALLDRIHQMNHMARAIAFLTRLHRRERMAVPGGLDRKLRGRLLYRVVIVDVAGAGPQGCAQHCGLQLGQV